MISSSDGIETTLPDSNFWWNDGRKAQYMRMLNLRLKSSELDKKHRQLSNSMPLTKCDSSELDVSLKFSKKSKNVQRQCI